jgi:hypothetical protein
MAPARRRAFVDHDHPAVDWMVITLVTFAPHVEPRVPFCDRLWPDAGPIIEHGPVKRRREDRIEGPPMSDKSPRKSNDKKQGRTLKEKRAAKKLKKTDKPSPIIPPSH